MDMNNECLPCNVLDGLVYVRSRTISKLRSSLISARGYHATQIADEISAHEAAMVRYADIIIAVNEQQKQLTTSKTVVH
jgi:hypothetical protein